MNKLIFRECKIEDFESAKLLIKEFSICVYGTDLTNINDIQMKKAIFDDKIVKYFFIEIDEKIAGYITYFNIYSTFKGQFGIYLEDLYVRESYSNKGIGTKVFEYLIELAKKNNYCKIEWNCLKSNINAMNFYEKKLMANNMDEFKFFTLENLN